MLQEPAADLSQVSRLSAIIAAIQEAEDREALKDGLSNGLGAFGFDSFTLGINARDKYELALSPTLTSYQDRLLREYERLGFAEVDPVLARTIGARQHFRVEIPRGKGNSRLEKRFNDFFHDIPAVSGLVIPLPSRAGHVSRINVKSRTPARWSEETVHCLSIIARVAMMKAECLGLSSGNDNSARLGDADLSGRQLEILHWAAQGKSNGDIAVIVGQSKRAVDWHMSEILRKLKVASRAQAVALLGTRRS